MIVEMVGQVVRIEVVNVVAKRIDDCRVFPSEIESGEFDVFSFAGLADFAFWLEHGVAPQISIIRTSHSPNFLGFLSFSLSHSVG